MYKSNQWEGRKKKKEQRKQTKNKKAQTSAGKNVKKV